MKYFFVTILVLSQLSGLFANKYQCCHSTSSLDGILKNYLDKWDDSKKSMGASLTAYEKNVSNTRSRESCECAQKDINAVKEGVASVVRQVARITDGCGQSLRQAITIAQYIERLAISNKSEKACNTSGESIEAITAAAKQIQRCQDQFRDTINAIVCGSSEDIDKIRSKNVGDEVFFNFAKLSAKISAAVNAFEKCKANVLEGLNAKLNALLNIDHGCGCNN